MPSYVCIGILTTLNVIIITFSRAELVTDRLPLFFFQGVTLLAVFVAARRLLREADRPKTFLVRLHYLAEGFFFLHISWLNLRIMNHLSMMVPFPYVDEVLADWDAALHLDWLAYLNAVVSSRILFQALASSYTSLTFLSAAVLVALISFGYIAQARKFIEAFLITALACLIIGAFFPAEAAVLFLVQDLSIFEPLGWVPGVYHVPYMDVLRSPSGPIVLDPAKLPGLVTFPSFHTASGVLIIWACRRTNLSVPAWIYSSVMIAATPVHGGHYFVDLISGALVALMSIWLVTRLHNRSGSAAHFLSVEAEMSV
ncbi:phosphatase PAP2 family protein [Roseivivax marinus]|uniref:phosphatase PAP2 family protein n=1 Tax=Roseivivax marinus TaxID=1379903 RepID=UPI001587BEC0|nr:phosphatase PAP2 family protein [Roseivivax marinus]